MPNVFQIENFIGGINESIDKSLIKQTEASSAQNCTIDSGVLESIDGTEKYSATSFVDNISNLMAFYTKTSSSLLLTGSGRIAKLNGAAYDNIITGLTDNNFDYINFQDEDKNVIIMTNGKDNAKVYDGTTIRDLKNRRAVYDDATDAILGYVDGGDATQTVKTEGECTSTAPKGKYIELHYDRIWLAGDEANPDMVYFTTANRHGWDIDDWTAPIKEGEANQHGGFINCASWDGGKVIGLKVIFDDVLIFKTKTIYKVFGTYPGNYQKVELFSSDGAIADRTIVKAHNKAYFVANEGIFLYDGTNVTPISAKIKNTWKNINKAALDKAVAVFKNNKYILAVPEGSSTVNNLIIEYDTLNNNFMLIRGINAVNFLDYDNELLISTGTPFIYKYKSGDDFDGTLISSYWESGTTSLSQLNTTKISQYLYFVGSGNGSVKFTLTTEKGDKSITVLLTSTELPYKKRLKNKGRLLKLRIENVNGCTFKLKQIELPLDVDID